MTGEQPPPSETSSPPRERESQPPFNKLVLGLPLVCTPLPAVWVIFLLFQRWEQVSPLISYHFSTFSVFWPCHIATPQSGTTVMGRDGGLCREEGWSDNGPSSQMMLYHYFCFRSKSEHYSCPGHSLKNRQITTLEHELLDGTTGATGAASGAAKGAGQARLRSLLHPPGHCR